MQWFPSAGRSSVPCPGRGKAAAQETISPEGSATGFSVASREGSSLRRDAVVVIAFIRCRSRREGPRFAGPHCVEPVALCPDETVLVDDDLSVRDRRRIRKCRLQLLLAHPVGCDAGRLVGLR
jgi:hypothetical protein